MGTNYYAIPKATDDLKIKIIEAVINNQMEQLKNLVPTKIHLGKSSYGWPFLFNHNNWEYYETINDLSEFIDGCEITNEYGDEMGAKQFKELIDQKQNTLDSKLASIDPKHYVIKDGYLFSTHTEFS